MVHVSELFRIDIEFGADGRAMVLLFSQLGRGAVSALLVGEATLTKDRWDKPVLEDTLSLDEIDRRSNGADTKDTRDRLAVSAANTYGSVPEFIEAFYPSRSPIITRGENSSVGLPRFVYEALQGNAAGAEWRENYNLKPLAEPRDWDHGMVINFGQIEGRVEADGYLYRVHLHRSDRKAFACEFARVGDGNVTLTIWSREADDALIAYGTQRGAEIAASDKAKADKKRADELAEEERRRAKVSKF